MRSILVLSTALLLSACADVKPIENGKAWGPVTSMIDLFTSCHLLETSAGPVLFDACWRGGELTARLRERGHAPDDVVAVFVTHGHADHVGGLELLKNARVLALEAEQPTLTEHAKAFGEIDQVLADGEVVTVGDKSVRVFAVPGHTPGSAAYLVDGALIVGDNGLITGKGAFAPVPEDRSDDPAQLIRSVVALAERLTAEGHVVQWLVPAHSGGVEGREALDAFAEANR
jgi:glyoxylase-like metal-dependent hydrolase (beta-lactamase superfamily II)